MLEILFQDENSVFVNKPSGLLVHRIKSEPGGVALLQMLRDQIGKKVYPIHRIDRSASGLVAFALSSESARGLQESFAQPTTEKVYITLVRGETPDYERIDRPLTDEKGVAQAALTEFWTLARCQYCSLLKVRIHTGRQHQIRRHLSHLAHQILGDRLHGKGRINAFYAEKYSLNRLFLHARSLTFDDIASGNKVRIEAPFPQELAQIVQQLATEGLFPLDVMQKI